MNNILNKNINVLGIETTCDETAAAIVSLNEKGESNLLSNIVHSQFNEHSKFGGIVPEVAARSHLKNISFIVEEAIKQSNISNEEVNAVSVSCGPGLIGGLLVGSMFGKAYSLSKSIPFIPINHLEAHILSPRLFQNIEFPYLALLVSGGHTQLLYVEDLDKISRIGTTLDDSVGEAFDKASIILDLGWPGGKNIEKAAENGDPQSYNLPRPMIKRNNADFSLSGLKTALFRIAEKETLNKKVKSNLAASFQSAVTDVIEDRCLNAFKIIKKINNNCKNFVVVGGVAANKVIRKRLTNLSKMKNFSPYFPPVEICTDNGAMIAWNGIEKILKYGISNINDPDFEPRTRWPLDPMAKPIRNAKEPR